MKKKILFTIILSFVITLVTCDAELFNGDNSRLLSKFDETAGYAEVDFLAEAVPICFGTSNKQANNSVVLGGNLNVPEGMIELRAINNGGKVAGSEDGMTFYFKEVDISKNFIMTADFTIKTFGSNADPDLADMAGSPEDTKLGSNGQEAWGIMARDFVPEWLTGKEADENLAADAKSYSIEAIRQRVIDKNPAKILAQRNSEGYRPGDRGGDSNMVMAGGVKRGARAYWRWGIKWDPDIPLTNTNSGNPIISAYMNAVTCKFYYLPRELGDYNSYTSQGGAPLMSGGVSEKGIATLAARPDFPSWGTTYTVTLKRTNQGFEYSIKSPDGKDSPKGRVPHYDILNSVNKEKYYVGIFAARDATVWVSNIKYWEADQNDCPPYVPPPPVGVNATMDVLSPTYWGGENYLYVKTNVNGELVVTQEGKQIPPASIQKEWKERDSGMANPHFLFTIPTWEHKEGDTLFTLSFSPDSKLPKEIIDAAEGEVYLSSNAAIRKNFIVSKRTIKANPIWVNPYGSIKNDGSKGSPLDLQSAINYIQPGQTIILENGTYDMKKPIVVPQYNSGTAAKRKILKAEKRGEVIFDWGKNPEMMKEGQGFSHGGSYWILDGFHVRHTPDGTKGISISGHNNIVKWLMIYNNGEAGFQISGRGEDHKSYWPSGNKVLYCEAFNNSDPAANNTNADGFAAKLTVGKDNEFWYCIAHNNVDDGWDFFSKRENGPTGTIKLVGCITYQNGILLPNGTDKKNWEYWGPRHEPPRAVRNGFKMGGEGISIRHEAIECLSFENDGEAFTSNSNPSIIVRNCTAVNTTGTGLAVIDIKSGDKSPADGFPENCVLAGEGGVNSYDYFPILEPRNYGGYNGMFLRRYLNVSETDPMYGLPILTEKPDGTPYNVFKPNGAEGSQGAWVFFAGKEYLENKHKIYEEK